MRVLLAHHELVSSVLSFVSKEFLGVTVGVVLIVFLTVISDRR